MWGKQPQHLPCVQAAARGITDALQKPTRSDYSNLAQTQKGCVLPASGSQKPAASIMPLAAEFKNKLIPSPRFPERVVCSLLSILSATLPSLSAAAAALPTPSTAGLFAVWVSSLCWLTPQLGTPCFPGVGRWGAGWIGDCQCCIHTQLAKTESQPAVPSGRARQQPGRAVKG